MTEVCIMECVVDALYEQIISERKDVLGKIQNKYGRTNDCYIVNKDISCKIATI